MSSKKDQRPDPQSNRQRLRATQEQAAKKAKTRKILQFSVLGVVLIALIGGITWAVISLNQGRSKQPTVNLNTTYTVSIGRADAPVVVDVYQDFICPACGVFEQMNAADIASLVDSGTMQYRMHVINFLDESSMGSKYSTRAANAFLTVAHVQPDKALAFNSALYANQPKEGTTGLTDPEIAQLAASAGVSQKTIAQFANNTYVNVPSQAWDAAQADNVHGTPTVFINGVEFTGDIYSAGPFKQAVEAAAAK